MLENRQTVTQGMRPTSSDCESADVSSEADEDERTASRRHIKEGCVHFLEFLFSTGGLVLLVSLYVVAGAFIFQYLEQHNEQAECFNRLGDYTTAESASQALLMQYLYQIMDNPMTTTDAENVVNEKFKGVLRAFSLSVIETGYSYGKNCSLMGQPDGPPYSWSWSGALFFSMTVVTTIGYGNIAPRTMWGRLVCISYAVLGIPIMLLCLAHVGELMANVFRFIYSTVCCCGCCKVKGKVIRPVEDNTVPQPKVQTWVTDSTGKPIPSQFVALSRKSSLSNNDTDKFVEDEEDDEEEDITVPLTISVVAIVSFVAVGAAVFTVWEDWSFLNGFYFCYITVTTIGFGDIVPGFTNLSSGDAQTEIIFTALYMVVGVAMISMCFQLMQDEMIAKVSWVAAKLGIGKKKPQN